MEHFAGSALLTLGGPRDVRWFAPRLLELTGSGELFDEPTRVARVCAADDVWRDAEREVIRRAFTALWALWIHGGVGAGPGWSYGEESAELLTACAWVGIDVRPLFAELATRPRRADERDELAQLAGQVGRDRATYGDDPLYWNFDVSVADCVTADPLLAAIAEEERMRAATWNR